MVIAAAQIQSIAGDVNANILKHHYFVAAAATYKCNMIVFPELSVTGYEPTMAKQIAMQSNDKRLQVFQKLSDTYTIVIATGVPVYKKHGIMISLVIFQPNTQPVIYSKQFLHEDELPFFIKGNEQVWLPVDDHIISPAICYESLLPEHAAAVRKGGAVFYVASVAKSAKGVAKAYAHYPEIARTYAMQVIMANAVGPADNFINAGSSGVWNSNGELVAALDETSESLLIFNTATGNAAKQMMGNNIPHI